jgi:hypothetical protein
VGELQLQQLDSLIGEKDQEIFLFYGESGVGKSLLVSQFPNVLVLACDPGNKGGLPRTALKYNPKLIKINSYTQIQNLIEGLKENAWKQFSVLAIDSVSFLQKMVMDNILMMVGREIPRFDEWNLNAERMRKLIARLCEVPVPIIFTALTGTVKDEVTGKITGGPDLPGKLAGELSRYCSVVARLKVNSSYDKNGVLTPSYRYTVVGDDTWYAKDRTGLVKPEGETGFDAFKAIFEVQQEEKG